MAEQEEELARQAQEISQIEDQNQRLTNELADEDAIIRHPESRAQSQTVREDTPASGVEPRAPKQQRIEDPEKFTADRNKCYT